MFDLQISCWFSSGSIQPRSEFERRSIGQKKPRQREYKENQTMVGFFCVSMTSSFYLMFFQQKRSESMNPRRSAAQRARRQHELAANIQGLLYTHGPENIRSRAQNLRRRVEEGEWRLKSDPKCGMSGKKLNYSALNPSGRIPHKLWTTHLILNIKWRNRGVKTDIERVIEVRCSDISLTLTAPHQLQLCL